MQAASPFRSLPADAAVQLALREAERLGMRFAKQRQYSTVISHLMRGDDQVAASGAGKGRGLEAIAGAYFEALERFYMSARINRRLADGAADLKSAKDVARQPGLAEDLVIQRWAKDYPESIAACAVYSEETSSVWYPIFLTDPDYYLEPLPGDSVDPYRSMLRYSSSIGTAAGVNSHESSLHGLCELIEHDALSLALLRWVVAGDPEVSVLDVTSLPGAAQLLHGIAAEAVGADVIVLDVTTDIGIPAYLAAKEGDAGPLGLGASPVGEHAVARALGELLQMAAGPAVPREASARLAAWPALQRCLTTPLGSVADRRAEHVPLRRSVCDTGTVQSGLDAVTGLLREHGIRCYTCELAPPGSHIRVTSTIAPGLERFSLVRFGLPVVPTGRGWSLWTTTTAPGLQREPVGHHVDAVLGPAAQPERVVRHGLDAEAADLVDGHRGGAAVPGFLLDDALTRRDYLADQGIRGDLKLDGQLC
jgi:ribosomal protein S12 methylthiotransferase accessory factor